MGEVWKTSAWKRSSIFRRITKIPDLKWPFDGGALVHHQNSTLIFVEQTKKQKTKNLKMCLVVFLFPGMTLRSYGTFVVIWIRFSQPAKIKANLWKPMTEKNISWWISWSTRWFWLELGWYRRYRNLWQIFGEEKTHETHSILYFINIKKHSRIEPYQKLPTFPTKPI